MPEQISMPKPMKIFFIIFFIFFFLILIFVIASYILFVRTDQGFRFFAKYNPCENPDLTVEEKIYCYSTKEFYAKKAFETNDISYCDSIPATLPYSIKGVIVDGQFDVRIVSQCKATLTNDISYCSNLDDFYYNSNKKIYYHLAECILHITNNDVNYCDRYLSSQKISKQQCLEIINKATGIQNKGLKNQLGTVQEWNDILSLF